ncbi:zf-TFIIB domain-containing protein [Limnohabitans sp. Rim11]|uniref:zf-TFIIB domain-containing protein n=1 Tax=Limnohabitans sp. Rim11 TaxID=1100719 RepID=UPI000B082FAE|nr:zf-TFIIB domain-containing protein [Limnohabitans sp. Rim11]
MTLSAGQNFTETEQQTAMQKMAMVVDLLESVCSVKDAVKKLKNHSIHDYTDFLFTWTASSCVSKGELEHLILELQEYKEDFKQSKNTWVKQRTAMVVELMQEMIDGNLAIQKRAYELLAEPYPYPEVVQVEIKTKKFHHTVATNNTCPSCQHNFKASEIVEHVEVGYRCPKCRQVIRLI